MEQTETIVQERAHQWLDSFFDETTRTAVQQLINKQGAELTDAFYKDLEFGTGGMRGIMGPGTNRINRYTLGQATQGLSNYLLRQFSDRPLRVVIGHDCRNNSRPFAQTVADVLSANGIEVFLFEDLRPTPEISFAIRHLNAHSGIVLTASHNPKEYNGYKVYWNDGAQLVPPHDQGVIDEVRQVAYDAIQFEGKPELIHEIGAELDDAFIDAVVGQSLSQEGKQDLKIVFTSLHGTSIKSMPQALEKAGFTHVHIVEEQATPDGNFPTVVSPNPEEPEALALAMEQADRIGADILLGTDPDADRIGIGVRNPEGQLVLLNGNQTAAVMTWYLLRQWHDQGKLEGKEFVAQTIVTTNLVEDIARSFGVNTYFCLTGFKWIAKIIREREATETFIGGGEESYGYMVGDFVRDKDSISSGMICCEIAAWAKAQGSSFFEVLEDIYRQYGLYQEHLISIKKEGKSGAEAIQQMMRDFREQTPESLDGIRVSATADYQAQVQKDLLTGEETTLELPPSNVFQIFLEDGSKITARPSGTEPKIKFYFSVKSPWNPSIPYAHQRQQALGKIDRIVQELGL